MTISEFISKYGQFFPIEVVKGTAFCFHAEDDAEDIEWFPIDIKEGFNFKTSKWEALENPVVDGDSEEDFEAGLERNGLFIRFRPPDEKWLYYPIEMTVVQTVSGITVPNEAIVSAQFYSSA